MNNYHPCLENVVKHCTAQADAMTTGDLIRFARTFIDEHTNYFDEEAKLTVLLDRLIIQRNEAVTRAAEIEERHAVLREELELQRERFSKLQVDFMGYVQKVAKEQEKSERDQAEAAAKSEAAWNALISKLGLKTV